MRQNRLIHRATYIIVFRPQKQKILVQKRRDTKDIYPGMLEIAAGGVVCQGETRAESAMRELQEETGIKEVPLQFHFDFYFEDETNRVWGRLFSCTWCNGLDFQEEEVEWGRFFRIQELEDSIYSGNFTPDSEYLFSLCKKRKIL